jgi:hypothetical protein
MSVGVLEAMRIVDVDHHMHVETPIENIYLQKESKVSVGVCRVC